MAGAAFVAFDTFGAGCFLAGAFFNAALFFAAGFFAAGFFLAAGFFGAGICMPGMWWCCAVAGALAMASATALAAAINWLFIWISPVAGGASRGAAGDRLLVPAVALRMLCATALALGRVGHARAAAHLLPGLLMVAAALVLARAMLTLLVLSMLALLVLSMLALLALLAVLRMSIGGLRRSGLGGGNERRGNQRHHD